MSEDRCVVEKNGIEIEEAAHRIGITEATVVCSLEQGFIRGRLSGNRWLVQRSCVERLERDRKLVLKLPLTALDFHCADCDEPMARCR